MRKNKQSFRSLIAFLVTWSFAVLTVTGIVLYIVPQGRVAYWVHWSLAGLEKAQWGWIHMMFGGVFIVTSILHLYFNWKPFKKYLADRVKGQLELKQEVFVATILTLVLIILSAFNLPPASWIITLNESIKQSWITSPELEPPFGHAEEVSLAGLTRRTNIDLEKAFQELKANGIQLDHMQESLEEIARANDTTPMALYGMISKHRNAVIPSEAPMTREEIEAKYAGTGIGRKRLEELCQSVGIKTDAAIVKLAAAGVAATPEEQVKAIAELHDLSPIELLQIILQQ